MNLLTAGGQQKVILDLPKDRPIVVPHVSIYKHPTQASDDLILTDPRILPSSLPFVLDLLAGVSELVNGSDEDFLIKRKHEKSPLSSIKKLVSLSFLFLAVCPPRALQTARAHMPVSLT
jgi:hypothetical protein